MMRELCAFPDEVLLTICTHTPALALGRLCAVCRQLRALLHSSAALETLNAACSSKVHATSFHDVVRMIRLEETLAALFLLHREASQLEDAVVRSRRSRHRFL